MNDHEQLGEDGAPVGTAVDDPRGRVDRPRDLESARDSARRGVRPRGVLTNLANSLRAHAVMSTAVVVAITLAAGTFAWTLRAAPPATVPEPSPAVHSSAAPLGSGTPGVRIVQPESHPIAALAADHAVGSVVDLDSRFRLTSADGTSAAALAARLTVTPDVSMTATPDRDDRGITLAPKDRLTPGVVYRFALAGSAGELVDTWAFQARQPVHVVGTLPENEQSDVPLDTGIEVTFDQDGAEDAASHMSIDPPTPGRFETHDRTLAFIADRPLTPRTVYTVTLTKGVVIGDTGEKTDADTRFAFETATTGAAPSERGLAFPVELVESAVAQRPVIGVWQTGDGEHPVTKAALAIYRFASISAAIDAWRSLRARPEWTRFSTRGLVDTSALERVVEAKVPVNGGRDGNWWVTLPERLPAGWYLAQLDGRRPVQAVLQVTDVAGYVSVSETQTLVWANDLTSGRAITGANADADGTTLGRTDAQGLLLARTPAALLPRPGTRCDRTCDPVVTVTAPGGRAVFLPTTTSHDKLEAIDGSGYFSSDGNQRFWALLNTDRARYRSTDTINVWGMIRSRVDLGVPSGLSVRLRTYDDPSANATAIAVVSVAASKTGVFLGSIPLVDLPEGTYTVELVAGDRTIRTISVDVGPIAKPAYQLQLATGRRVYLAGDRIKVTVRASFFEGTPVPGLPVRVDSEVPHPATTAGDGTAVVRLVAQPERDEEGPTVRSVAATPARAEEGGIVGVTQDYFVYSSTRVIDGEASVVAGRVAVTGSVHELARNRLERLIAAGARFWELDPRGPAIGRASVNVQFIELVPTRVLDGSTYDYIAKKVVPIYRVDVVSLPRGTFHVTTTESGRFRAALANPVAGHDYRVVVSVADPDGRVARSTILASSAIGPESDVENASLQLTHPRPDGSGQFGLGDTVDVTMTGGATAAPRSRYLFFVAHQGIRSAVVQGSPRFALPFATWALPNLEIVAVRFDGQGYAGDTRFEARFRSSDRRLDVRLAPDAARYRPGDTATVRVRTLDPKGSPVPATVVVRAVDEKLFSIGMAQSDDPVGELYLPVEFGIVGAYASHHGPPPDGGGGDTTGGGGDERDNFKDTVLFRAVTTDASGQGSVTFKLPDDLTAWRVSASAISGRLEAGTASLLLPVGLPFFVDASIAPEYLLGDRPEISVRTYGSALAPGAPVMVTLSSPGLGSTGVPVTTRAFSTVDLPLPTLRLGVQTVTITATTGTGSAARTDRLTRTFRVVETRLTRSVTSLSTLTANGPGTLPAGHLGGGAGLTTIVVSDAGAGAYLPLLHELSSATGPRLEQALAAELADRLLVDRFGFDGADLEASGFATDRYQSNDSGGLAILPYATADVETSTMAALVAAGRVKRQRLAEYLRGVHVDSEATRERRLLAAAGLAALGDPVLPELQRGAADQSLTVREQLYVAIGAAAAGDSATARAVARRLVASAGERLGAVARLRVGDDVADTRQATALMAVLAAMIGEADAPLFWAYVASTPGTDRVESLAEIGYIAASLQRLATAPASFAVTVDGHRTTVKLDRGESHRLVLTPTQVASLGIDRLTGSIAIVASWRAAAPLSAFKADPDVTIVRAVEPARVHGSSLVRVDLTVTFGPSAAPGCHDVTELLPSGLTPVGVTTAWPDPGAEDQPTSGFVTPYEQSGSFARFCADPHAGSESDLRYYARAITPGTYVWEPAVVESSTQSGGGSVTSATTLTIE